MDKAEDAGAEGGPGVDAEGDRGASASGALEGERCGGLRVWVGFTCRRVRVDPERKREEYIARLEAVMDYCDRVASDPGGFEGLQVRALDVMIRAVRVCYGLVSDLEVGLLEGEVEELKRREAELRGGLGYGLPESAS